MSERAFLVGVEFTGGIAALPVEESLAELGLLAETAGLELSGEAIQRLSAPHVATYIGSGKVDEVKMLANEFSADVILFDDELNPRHQRELEKRFGDDFKVVDRTALILDIFAQHAQTSEGQLQVELAQLEYRLPRLTRMWTHLARQAGGRAGGASGGVGVRGPGEKQIESDRREIQQRIKRIKRDLLAVRNRRKQQRMKRQQTALPVTALVGYTNAGKSTLLNALSGSNLLSADKLFATLDPTTRAVEVVGGRRMLFTDTVGFIQKLPTQIVAAFRATLEEINDAHLLLHVVDISHPHALAHIEVVQDTLAELDVTGLPMVIALNKVDKLSPTEKAKLKMLPLDMPAIPTSAVTGEGLDALLVALQTALESTMSLLAVHLPYQRGDLLSLFYERGQVDEEIHQADGVTMRGKLPHRLLPYFEPYQLEIEKQTVL